MSKGQRQEGGDHYDRTVDAFDVVDAYGLDFYAGNVVKYVMRAGRKDGLADLLKAEHYLEICIRHARGLSTRPSTGPDAPRLSEDIPEVVGGGPCRYCGRDFSHGPWEGGRGLSRQSRCNLLLLPEKDPTAGSRPGLLRMWVEPEHRPDHRSSLLQQQ